MSLQAPWGWGGEGSQEQKGRGAVAEGGKVKGTLVFINGRLSGSGGDVGVCATALAEDVSLSGWGRRGKRTGYFLLSSSGSGRREGRMRQGAGGERRRPSQALCPSPWAHSPGGSVQPPTPPAPDSPVSHTPLLPSTAAPAAHSSAPSQRSPAAAQLTARGQASSPPAGKRGRGRGSRALGRSSERE